jgi:hypothetical protein
MADRKISDLTALTAPAAGDYLPIVDISEVAAASKNKRITIEELFRGVPDGTAAAPAIAPESDPNTGIYSSGADQLSIATNGTERLRIDSAGQIEAVSLGTAAAPTFSFTGDPNTGIYSPGADQLAISTNGSQRFRIDESGNRNFPGTTGEVRIPAGGESLEFTKNGSIYISAKGGSGSFFIFETGGGNERMRLDSTGRLGLGTSSPRALIDVSGSDGNTSFSGAGVLNASRVYQNGIVGVIHNTNATLGAFSGLQLISSSSGNLSSTGLLTVPDPSGGLSSSFVITQRTATDTMSERLRVDSSGRVGIGTTAPTATVHVKGGSVNPSAIVHLQPDNNTVSNYITFRSATDTTRGYIEYNYASDFLALATGTGVERARIDSSGRLLVGTSTARSNLDGSTPGFQIEGLSNNSNRYIGHIYTSPDVGGPEIHFAKSRGTSIGSNVVTQADDQVGTIFFEGSDGTNFIRAASIRAFVDGTPGANDMPGRLVFSTTADGAASPTERMRIDSSGKLLVGTTTAVGAADVVSPRGFVSRSVALTLNGTSTVTVPSGCICAMTTDGFPGDSAIFSIKASGGSQGCYVLSQGTAGTIGFGTTSNPSTGTRLNVWISAGLTMSIQDVNQGARTILLTFMSVS